MKNIVLILGSVLAAIVVGLLVALQPLVLLLVGVGCFIGYLLIRSKFSLLYAGIASVALGQLGRIPPGSSGSSILLLDVLLAGLFLSWIMVAIARKETLITTSVHKTWAGFMLIGFAALVFGPFLLSKRDLAMNAFYFIRLVFYSGLLWIIPSMITSQVEAKKLMNWLIGTGQAVLLLGFVQLYIFPDIGFLSRFGWDPHVGRLLSTFLDPNYLGGFFAVLLAVVLARTLGEKTKFPWLTVGLTLIATVLTFSRSGYLAVLIVVMAYTVLYSWKLLVIGLLCVVPLALSIPRVRDRVSGGFNIDTTSQARIDSWMIGLSISDKYPGGVGINSYKSAQEALGIITPGDNSHANGGSDSSLIDVEVMSGWFGLALFFVAAVLMFKKIRMAMKNPESSVQKSAAYALYLSAPALFVHSFFVNSLFFPFILLYLCVLAGLFFVAPKFSPEP